MKPRKALIPAAGLGTRFLPATKVVPKELLPIVDRPALEVVVEELANSGIEEIVLVISPDKEAVFTHFTPGGAVEEALRGRGQLDRLDRHNDLLKRVRFHRAYQIKPKGLGHAVLCGQDQIGDEPFVVVLPDDLIHSKVPCVRQLLDVYEAQGCSTVAVQQVAQEDVSSYGIVGGPDATSGKAFRVDQIIEKPKAESAPSRCAIVGRYVLDPEVFSILKNVRPGAIGEIQLTDALVTLAKSKGLYAVPFEGFRMDVGQPYGYLEANLHYAMERPDIAPRLKAIVERLMGKK